MFRKKYLKNIIIIKFNLIIIIFLSIWKLFKYNLFVNCLIFLEEKNEYIFFLLVFLIEIKII